MCYKENKQDKELKKLLLRKITNQDEKGGKYVFISNNIAIRKKRSKTFSYIAFVAKVKNAIRIQIWGTLIAQQLLRGKENIFKHSKFSKTTFNELSESGGVVEKP